MSRARKRKSCQEFATVSMNVCDTTRRDADERERDMLIASMIKSSTEHVLGQKTTAMKFSLQRSSMCSSLRNRLHLQKRTG
jgi:hypothetical protein